MAWKLSWLTTGQCPQAEPRAWARGRVGLSERQSNPSLDLRVQPFSRGINRLFLASILILDLFFIMALIECLFCKYISIEATPRWLFSPKIWALCLVAQLFNLTLPRHMKHSCLSVCGLRTMFFVFLFLFSLVEERWTANWPAAEETPDHISDSSGEDAQGSTYRIHLNLGMSSRARARLPFGRQSFLFSLATRGRLCS